MEMNFSAVKEMDKRFKATDKKILGIEKEIESISLRINELTEKRGELMLELENENKVKDDLTSLSDRLNMLNGDIEMMNYLFLGYMMQNGMTLCETPDERAAEVLADVQKKKRAKRRSSKEMDEYRVYKNTIHEACVGTKESKLLHKAYTYMNKHYGVCFDQEKKDFFAAYERNPHSTVELCYWMERVNPANKNLLLSCINTIAKEKEV